MKKKTFPIVRLLFGVNLLVVALSVAMILTGHRFVSFAQVIAVDVFLTILMCIITMSIVLKRSMKTTLYDYQNIQLVAGILFAYVLEITLLTKFISCIKNEMTPKELFSAMVAFPKQFSYCTVLGIFFVGILLCISNVVLIRREGFFLYNALGAVLIVFYLLGTAGVYVACDFLATKRVVLGPVWMTAGFILDLFLLLMLCYFECVFIGSALLGYQAAKSEPKMDKDYIIILGCSIDKRGGLLPLLKGRVNRAMRFAWQQEIETGKPMKYVPSGGQGPNEIMSEGSAMELYLKAKGAEDDEVFPERKSTSTYENFLFSKDVIDSLKPNAKVAFATTNYHILRSGILARRAGVEAEGIAGDTKWYFWPNGFVREFFAILAMEKKSHILTAVILFGFSCFVGVFGFLGNMI